MKKGICVHQLLEMKPCTGKRCYECELSPAYKMGQQSEQERIWPIMKEINDLVYQEGYDKGFKEGMSKSNQTE